MGHHRRATTGDPRTAVPGLDWTGRIALSAAPQGSSRDDQIDPYRLSILPNRPRPARALPPHGYRRAYPSANPKSASIKSHTDSVGPTAGERLRESEQDRKARSNDEVRFWRSDFGAMSLSRTLRQKFPFLRYSFLRAAFGGMNVIRTG